MTYSLRFIITAPLVSVATLVLAGCGKAPIETYRVPHEVSGNEPQGGDMASQAVPAAGGAPEISWVLPAGWTDQPDQTGMRKGSFAVRDNGGHEATIAITVFPGDVGGDLANINRWLGQVQQPPVTEADLPRLVTELTLPAGSFQQVDLMGAGPEPTDPAHDHRQRILGAWHKQESRTWFVKMTGDATLVGAQADNFAKLLGSLKFIEAKETAPVGTTAPVAAPSASTAGSGPLAWAAPAGWQAKELGTMRKASYTVGGEGDFSVIAFPGDAGGDLANVNRWRGQVQMTAYTPAEFASASTTIKNGSLTFTVVDFAHDGVRLTGAILPFDGQTWFFKLMGPDAVVAAAKPQFIDFLNSVTVR